jgi:membrane fusion protein, multidrug efflux system
MKSMRFRFPTRFFDRITLMLLVCGLSLGSAVVMTTGCTAKPAQVTARPAPVKVAMALGTNVGQSWEYAGEIKPRFETTLSFRVPGKVAKRFVNLGEIVTGASVVARLDTADLKLASAQADAAVDQARAQATLAADDLLRHRDLFARDLIAKAELERREAASATASAQLSALQAAAEQSAHAARYGELTAGNPGVVTGVMVEAGQVVAAGQPVAQVAQTRQVEASFAVPETQIRNVTAGQAVTVRLVGSDVERSGHVREIAGMTDAVGRTYAVRVQLDDAAAMDEGALRLGMSAVVTVRKGPTTQLNAPEAGALVPLAAVVGDGKANYVLVIEQGKAVRRAVTMQQVVRGNLVSISGVKPGETVIATGAQFVEPGASVAPIQAKGEPS